MLGGAIGLTAGIGCTFAPKFWGLGGIPGFIYAWGTFIPKDIWCGTPWNGGFPWGRPPGG